MPRATVGERAQADVLLKSRRRCCICFGLNRDTSIKQGQIAHLDQDASNNDEDNLAFLCFDHHDQYDSRTRQSKGLLEAEVKRFREELVIAIAQAFNESVVFGHAASGALDPIVGHYIRDGEFDSADIRVERLADRRYHITGLALWGKTREYGPNLGDLDFIGEAKNGSITYAQVFGVDREYQAELKFQDGQLTVTEANCSGIFGMNVSFAGHYRRAS